MNRINLDAAMVEKLLGPMQPVEVCDESGNVIGFFSPKMDASQFEDVGPQISDEEIERRLNSKERRYSTAEVLRRLGKK
jgi:hypothetical protein